MDLPRQIDELEVLQLIVDALSSRRIGLAGLQDGLGIGPALLPVNLHHGAHAGRIRPGQLVLGLSNGSASTTGAIVFRWGDVALGPPPPPPAAVE